jgi:hypothetical protein
VHCRSSHEFSSELSHTDSTFIVKNLQMKTFAKVAAFTRSVTVAGLLWMFPALSSGQVVLPPGTPETPGVALLANTPGILSGTVLFALDSAFVDNAVPTPFATGLLRSFVVDRDPGVGIALDFVFQLVNTSAPPADLTSEFFRLKTTGGFNAPITTSVANTNAFAGLGAGPGSGFVAGSYTQGAALEDAASADRDVGTLGSIGFDFPTQPPLPFIGDFRNVGQGESSSFLVVRTNATTFGTVPVAISGAATGFASGLAPIGTPIAPVPELGPGLIGLGLVMLGICFLKARETAVQKS